MDLDHLKQLLTLVQEHGVSELEIEQDGLRVKVREGCPAPAGQMLHAAPRGAGAVAPPATAVPTAVAIPGSAAAGTSSEEE